MYAKRLSARTVWAKHNLVLCLIVVLLSLWSPCRVDAQQNIALKGTFTSSATDGVDIFTGKLEQILPLINVQGRGDISQALFLPLRNSEWRATETTSTTTTDRTYHYYTALQNNYSNNYLRGGYGSLGKLEVETKYTGWSFMETYSVTEIRFTSNSGSILAFRDMLTNGQPYEARSRGCVFSTYQTPNPPPSCSRGRVFRSTDGSNVLFVADTDIYDIILDGGANGPNPYPTQTNIAGTMFLSNGTRNRIENNFNQITKITDRNGNYMNIEYITEPGYTQYFLKKIKDSLNREVSISYGDASQQSYFDEIVYKGFGETERRLRINYTAIGNVMLPGESLGVPLFPGLHTRCYMLTTGATCDPTPAGGVPGAHYATSIAVPSSLVLPNGKAYQFYYNRYLEVARIKYPTGSYTDYLYGGTIGAGDDGFTEPLYSGGGDIYRRVVAVRNYDETGQLVNEKSFSNIPQYVNQSQLVDNVAVEVKDSNGIALTKSRHYFYDVPASQSLYTIIPFNYGKEHKTEVLDPATQAVLRSTETTLQQRQGFQWCSTAYGSFYNCDGSLSSGPPVDPRVVEVKTTLETGQVATKTYSYDQYNNITDTYEYDYGIGQPGLLLRRSHTDYLTDPNYTSYTSSYLLRLPAQNWVSSDLNGNNKTSFAQYEYDNYSSDTNHAPLMSRSNVSGFDTTYNVSFIRRGNRTAATSFTNTQNQTGPITEYSQYDIIGNIVKSIDGRGAFTTLDFTDRFGSPNGEARGNWDTVSMPIQLAGQSTFAFPTRSTNALSYTSYTQFDYSTGFIIDAEDINGVVSTSLYNDPLDRQTQLISANNRPDLRSQKTTIFDDTNRVVTITSDLFTFGDNLSKSESFYNSLGQSVESRTYEAGGYRVIKSIFDPLGRLAYSSNPYRPYLGESAVWTYTEYDSLGRARKVRAPDNSQVTTSYYGNVMTVVDQAGRTRRTLVNALEQLIRIDEPNDQNDIGSIDNPTQPTFYTYNANGQMVKVVQGSQTRWFLYDSAGRLLRVKQPEQDANPNLAFTDPITNNSQWSTASTYDANGNPLTMTDAKGTVITQTYDSLNRVITRTYSDGTPTVTHTYDDPNVAFSKGQLTKVSSSISTTEYTSFDELGRIRSHKQTTGGQSYTTAYTYNLSGALVEEVYPSGRIVKSTFNNDSKLADVSSKSASQTAFQSYANSFAYTAHGSVSQMRLGNGDWESMQFNSRLQVTQIALGTVPNASDLFQVVYDYGEIDNNGNLQTDKNSGNMARQTINFNGLAQPFVQTYKYDQLNRLREAKEMSGTTQTWIQSFTYDRYGNRLSFSQQKIGEPSITQTPAVNPASNRFQLGQGFGYDFNGNVTQDNQNRQFIFNGDNRQVEVRDINNNVIGLYYYDGNGHRVKKVTLSETVVFVYDAGGKLVAEYSTQSVTNPTTNYMTTDNLGSPRAITGPTGSVISRRDFMPFGEELLAGTANRTEAQKFGFGNDRVRKRFTGFEKDNETGLDFAEARYYDNRYARFTAVDPLLASGKGANAQSFNRYAYVMNNPLILTDSTGMWSDHDWVTTNTFTSLFDEGPSIKLPIPYIEFKVPVQRRQSDTAPAQQPTAQPAQQQGQSAPPAQPQPQTLQERVRQNFLQTMQEQAHQRALRTFPIFYGLGEVVPSESTFHCNCAARGLGFTDRWVQAGQYGMVGQIITYPMNMENGRLVPGQGQALTREYYYWDEIPKFFGGTPLGVGQTCPANTYQLRTFHDSTFLNETVGFGKTLQYGTIHVMFQQSPGSMFWASKNGGGPFYQGITDPNGFYRYHYNPIGTVTTTDYCMPAKRP